MSREGAWDFEPLPRHCCREHYTVRLDREGAEWLAAQAGDLGRQTKDHGWTEIAESLEEQLTEGTAP